MKQRRIFSREFKLAAVKKIVEQGLSATEVARDLGNSQHLAAQLEASLPSRWNASTGNPRFSHCRR
jgi:transposase-like protein